MRVKTFWVWLLLLAAVALWSDIPAPQINILRQGGDPSESIAHISGFSQYPDRAFWLVERYRNTDNARDYVLLQKLDSDSLTVDTKRYSRDPAITAQKYIFWSSNMSRYESGKEYLAEEVYWGSFSASPGQTSSQEIFISPFPPRNSGRIDYGSGSIPATNILPRDYLGFQELHHYYTIQLFDRWDPNRTPNVTPEFVLKQTREVWIHPQLTITNNDQSTHMHDVRVFLEQRTKADMPPAKNKGTNKVAGKNISWEMLQDDLDALLEYVPTLPNHILELKNPKARPKVYTHDSRAYIPERYAVPARLPVSYKLLTVSLSVLACLGVAILLFRVMKK